MPGKTIVEHDGLVAGNTVRAKHVGRDIAAGFKNLVGGELKGYTELLGEARTQAMQRIVGRAKASGANAVVNVRFSTSAVAQGAAELYEAAACRAGLTCFRPILIRPSGSKRFKGSRVPVPRLFDRLYLQSE